jgi:hypothetical protein
MNNVNLVPLAILLITPVVMGHHTHAGVSSPDGTPKWWCEDPAEWGVHEYTSTHPVLSSSGYDLSDPLLAAPAPPIDGDTQSCSGGLLDFDGHPEYAVGGAVLQVETRAACDPQSGHHPAFGPIWVRDNIAGSTISFLIASDTASSVDTPPDLPSCGDGVFDEATVCVNVCTVTFRPGLDGAYTVLVASVLFSGGHVGTGSPAGAHAFRCGNNPTVVLC